MTISMIRKATAEDASRVDRAAARFILRHQIKIDDFYAPIDSEIAIDYWCSMESSGPDEKRRREYLWQKCLCRALREPYDARTLWSDALGVVGIRVN